ncbi:MAG TPA: hypothetical protein VJZ00_14475 [Thermoanaerobaculia bacterium]|nr:hypothetical protein [Thermoanaerobaculia bacterium]
MTRDEYRKRIAQFRPLMGVFRGDLECGEVGGSSGNISAREDGREYHAGGAVSVVEARAIVTAVNFVRELCARDGRSAGDRALHPNGAEAVAGEAQAS